MSQPRSDSDGAVLQLTPNEVLSLLAYDDESNCYIDDKDGSCHNNNSHNETDPSNNEQPLTGETMEQLSRRMKADVRCVDVHEFVKLSRNNNSPICDARSPGEFGIGHIPNAINLPLFTNQERAVVGTLYNHKGRSEAMLRGMSLVRPKLDHLVATAKSIVAKNNNNNNVLLLHCWRGGMRSCALAFLVQTRIPGLQVYVLKGGYKAFRQWQHHLYCYLPSRSSYSDSYDNTNVVVSNTTTPLLRHRKPKKMTPKQKLKRAVREASASGIGIEKRRASIEKVRERDYIEVSPEAEAQRQLEESLVRAKEEADWDAKFTKGPRIAIIGGPTGSGKTRVLLALRDVLGEQIIDLEGLAHHSGSAFGFVGHSPQPTPQQYTNNVAVQWNSLDPERWVFIEDEGPNIGRVNLPIGLYRNMRTASAVLKLDVPKDIRVEVLREDYALPEKKPKDCDTINQDENESKWLSDMIEATRTLEKRIGQVKMNSMIAMLRDGDYAGFANAALDYYDGLYAKHISNEHGSANMKGNGKRAASIATVTVPNMERFDAEALARKVVATLARTQVSTE